MSLRRDDFGERGVDEFRRVRCSRQGLSDFLYIALASQSPFHASLAAYFISCGAYATRTRLNFILSTGPADTPAREHSRYHSIGDRYRFHEQVMMILSKMLDIVYFSISIS